MHSEGELTDIDCFIKFLRRLNSSQLLYFLFGLSSLYKIFQFWYINWFWKLVKDSWYDSKSLANFTNCFDNRGYACTQWLKASLCTSHTSHYAYVQITLSYIKKIPFFVSLLFSYLLKIFFGLVKNSFWRFHMTKFQTLRLQNLVSCWKETWSMSSLQVIVISCTWVFYVHPYAILL